MNENQRNEVGMTSGHDYARSEPKRNQEFAVHMLNDAGKANAADIRDAFDDLLNRLTQLCTEGRHFAVTKTKLEEACFFAKKAMAINLGNQQH